MLPVLVMQLLLLLLLGVQFKFSLNQLPPWAQNQVISRPSVAASIGLDIQQDKVPVIESHVSHVTGKWAEVVIVTCTYMLSCNYDNIYFRELMKLHQCSLLLIWTNVQVFISYCLVCVCINNVVCCL